MIIIRRCGITTLKIKVKIHLSNAMNIENNNTHISGIRQNAIYPKKSGERSTKYEISLKKVVLVCTLRH